MARVQLYYEGIGDVMRISKVRRALSAQAHRIGGNARSASATEGVNSAISVEEGTRPKGRPYARVVSDAVNAEYGTAKTPRRRLLARAADL